MRRRKRALAFLLLALLAAAAAAAIAAGYGARAVRGFGPLRSVVVLGARIAAGRRIGPEEIDSALRVRRVPVRFVPPGTLVAPEEALGLFARVPLSAGSYLLGTQLGIARKARREGPSLGGGRRPVEIAVGGADALLASGPPSPGSRVDVVVTSEPAAAGPGRTYVAAARVPLLALRPGSEGPGPGMMAAATLGLTKGQALRLIAAESFARKVTLLPED
jgi:Flp pilus assembly protein CpaB